MNPGLRPHREQFQQPIAAVMLIALVTLAAVACAASEKPPLERAPETKYMAPTGQTPRTGFIPPPVALNPRILPPAGDGAPKVLPTRYDCRDLGYVTPVKDQGACGACYAFSAAGDLESTLLRGSEGTYDFSENNIKDCEYYVSGCAGGNSLRVANHVSRNGVVLEVCDPYDPDVVACDLACEYRYCGLGWSTVSGSTVPPTSTLKQYLQLYGPIQTTLFVGDGTAVAWRNLFNSYGAVSDPLYFDDPSHAVNHAVLLIGWDDSIAHDGGTGCWIAKNSWGTTWGNTCDYGTERGYFYIAYESANIGEYSTFFHEFIPVQEDAELQSYDEAGYTAAFGHGSSTVYWGMAKFVLPASPETAYLHRVEFWTTDATNDVDIYVYDNFVGGTLNTLLTTVMNQSFDMSGYHSVPLPTPLELAGGQDIYVAIRIYNDSIPYPLACDADGPVEDNTTYYSFTGTVWGDLGDDGPADLGFRIRTSPYTDLAVDDPGQQPDDDQDDQDDETPASFRLHDAVPNPFNPTTTISFTLPHPTRVELAIYDLEGKLVRTLVDRPENSGTYNELWNGRDDAGRDVPAGVYCYRLETDTFMQAKKMVLLK